jgi:copper chaperone NosL
VTARSLLVTTLAAGSLLPIACWGGSDPARITASDSCAFCRMTVSDLRVAAQVVAPGEDPRVFDDIGCLVNGLKSAAMPDAAVAYVADHRTGEWVRASDAVYSRIPGRSTPMGSHLVAHASAASRAADEPAASGQALTVAEVFGPGGPPGGHDVR